MRHRRRACQNRNGLVMCVSWPGDIVLLSTGDVVPADGAVLGRNDLAINEKVPLFVHRELKLTLC